MNVTTMTNWSTTAATPPGLPYSTHVTALIILVTSLLTIGVVLGNSLVILAVFQVHKLRTPSNYLIVSLAVSDWFVGAFLMPLSILYEILGRWPLGPVGCIIWVTFDVTLCTASILNLMMISIDRYLIITKPFRYSQLRTNKLMVVYMVVAWLTSLVISITPLFVGWFPEYGSGELCMVNQEIGYQAYATTAAFYLPLLVMFGLYGKIFYISRKIAMAEAKNNPTPISATNNNNNMRAASTRRRATVGHVSYYAKPQTTELCIAHSLEEIQHLDHRSDSGFDTVEDMEVTPSHFNGLPLPTIVEQKDVSCDPQDESVGDVSDIEAFASSQEDVGHENDWLHPRPRGSQTESGFGSLSLKKFSIATLSSIKNFLSRRKSRRNTQAIRTLGVIMGLFTACWLPFFVLAVVAPICGDACSVPKWVWGALVWLGYANSCFNPIIYARFNREFRVPFKEIICCRCHTINQTVRHTDYLYQYGD